MPDKVRLLLCNLDHYNKYVLRNIIIYYACHHVLIVYYDIVIL